MKFLLYIFASCITFATFAQVPFLPLSSDKSLEGLQISKSLQYKILFAEGDSVFYNLTATAPAKGDHDYNCFIAEDGSSENGLLYVSHEGNDSSTALGDGGGATVLKLAKADNQWKVLRKDNVNFASVGGTMTNCSGALTANNTVITAEEFPPNNNTQLFRKGKGFRDTTDYQGRPRWQNMGWMVEADPYSKKSIQKLYALGRYSHEGALIMPNNKTMYLTDDYSPSVFFKFVANNANDFSTGHLYAYQQIDGGNSGNWLPLPMSMDSLLIAREVALRLGATFFLRMEWLTMVDGKIYISETGTDEFEYSTRQCYLGKPAQHLLKIQKSINNKAIIDYPFGAVLVFDPINNTINPIIVGGVGTKFPKKHFSNPDGITFCKHLNKQYLVINEDILGFSKGRVSATEAQQKQVINDIWWLDLSLPNPQVDDLQKMLTTPLGAESTGGYFTPDFKSYFVNIQHPSRTNKAPWNKSCTLVITGW